MEHVFLAPPEKSNPLRVWLSHPVLNPHEVQTVDINPIARAQLERRKPTSNLCDQSAVTTHFTLVDSPQAADIHLLPLTWNWYLRESRLGLVADGLSTAKMHGKPIVLFSEGDFTAKVPFSGLTIFESCCYRSRRNEHGNKVFAKPAFIPDFVTLYSYGNIPLREKKSRPVVGFCGLAGGTWYHLAYRLLKLQMAKVAFGLGVRRWEPPPFEPSLFRRHVLSLLEKDRRLTCNFILRNRYRAGYRAKKKDPFHPTRMEFVNNLLESDYIVCMRGGGNFSVRFYETLSMGRIPIFVDTDCILPYDHILDYRDIGVWIEHSDLSQIADKVVAFHNSLSPEAFVQLQVRCRELWRSYLSEEGFWRHFAMHFSHVEKGSDLRQ